MLNQSTVEALYSATYVENYLDCVENLPDDLQRYLSRMRELDISYQAFLKDVEQQQEIIIRKDPESQVRKRAILRIQQALIAAQEVGDEKLQIVQQINDLIENKARQLDLDFKNLDIGKEQENADSGTKDSTPREQQGGTGSGGINNTSGIIVGGGSGGERQSKRSRRSRTDNIVVMESSATVEQPPPPEPVTPMPRTTASASSHKKANNTAGKKKKRKSRQTQQREETPPREEELAIDPDEPTYCLCDQISYGEMILCDNDLCPIEWFHFSCVALTTKPKGKWFCPKCRGDRPNVMKPKAQFLKELERYNKEKEEKA